jgi:heat shock protein HtpX
MFIVNPLSGKQMMSLFSTHPPIEDRVARLTGRRQPPASPGNTGTGRPSTMEEQGRSFWDNLS